MPIPAITGFEVATDLALLGGRWYASDSTAPDEFVRRFTARCGHNHVCGVGNYGAVSGKPGAAQRLAATENIARFPSIFDGLSDKEGIISCAPVYRSI